MTKDDGRSAFPVPGGYRLAGMSLRDWFAGQALMGILAHPDALYAMNEDVWLAYKYADAMLAGRAKK